MKNMLCFVLTLVAIFTASANINAQPPLPIECKKCEFEKTPNTSTSVWDRMASWDKLGTFSYEEILDTLKQSHPFEYKVEEGTGAGRVLRSKIEIDSKEDLPRQTLRNLITNLYVPIGAPVKFVGNTAIIVGHRLSTTSTSPEPTAQSTQQTIVHNAPVVYQNTDENPGEAEMLAMREELARARSERDAAMRRAAQTKEPPPIQEIPSPQAQPQAQALPSNYQYEAYVTRPLPPPPVAPSMAVYVTGAGAIIAPNRHSWADWSFTGRRDELNRPIYVPRGSGLFNRQPRNTSLGYGTGYGYGGHGYSSGYGYRGGNNYLGMGPLGPYADCSMFPENRNCAYGGLWIDGPSGPGSEKFLKQFDVYCNGFNLGPASKYNRKPNDPRPVPVGPCKLEIKYRYTGEVRFTTHVDILSFYAMKDRTENNIVAVDDLNMHTAVPKHLQEKKDEKKD